MKISNNNTETDYYISKGYNYKFTPINDHIFEYSFNFMEDNKEYIFRTQLDLSMTEINIIKENGTSFFMPSQIREAKCNINIKRDNEIVFTIKEITKEPITKEMTIEEIEKQLGCKIKITGK